MMPEGPSQAQARASDPAVSVWVSANAGSGKTKVLTDRVTRLLVAGVDPARILCLTYTEAAAAEMQNRLFDRLGEWAMKADGELAAEMAKAGVAGAADPDRLSAARRLFARALEVPGGLRIQTIHAFCAGLLRRFPLEAGVWPGFATLVEISAREARAAALDALAEGAGREATERLAELWSGADIDALLKELASHRDAFRRPATPAELRRKLGVAEDESLARILADTFTGEEPALAARVIAVCDGGGSRDEKLSALLRRLDFANPDAATLAACEAGLLYGASAGRGASPNVPFTARIGATPGKAAQAALGPHLDEWNAFMLRVEAARRRRVALAAAEAACALHDFARPFLDAYADDKGRRGLLDFDDLILKARDLLHAPGVAPWVLWKLDGGIEHLLVDEAQDTSPVQWSLIEALTAEFAAGAGRATGDGIPRTLFVVGDEKQSIFSFQGADVDLYRATRDRLREGLAAAGQPFAEVPLLHSFRSAPAVLRVVDGVFNRSLPGTLPASGHIAYFADMPGRVELLPLMEKPAAPSPAAEKGEDAALGAEDAAEALARMVVGRIRAMLAAGTQVPLRKAGGGSRRMTPGDVLILFRKRSDVFNAVVRVCKASGLPVAGADRVLLTEALAVRDILAVLSVLALPEDDLSLAAALRSPVFGWTEAQLYALARGRTGSLWDRLRAQGGEAAAILSDLRDRADFLRPHDLIQRLLVRHGARARLRARLGPESEDVIDALLAQALAYESGRVPSVTGFLAWMENGEIEVSRQAANAAGMIRVMTVHGAKGLEAPVVVLPDCGATQLRESAHLATLEDGTKLWRPTGTDVPEALAELLRRQKTRDQEEEDRLLYVAMTRAESWLIAGGLRRKGDGEGKGDRPLSWHERIARGIEAAGAVATPGGGRLHAAGDWPPDLGPEPTASGARATLPVWAATPAPHVPRPPRPLSPSDLGGAKALPGEGDEAEAAKARGTALHRLFEELPGLPPGDRAAWAAAAGTAPETLAEVQAVLDDPGLAFLFAPETLAEAAFAAPWAGRPLSGAIDRLVLAPDRVLAVDFKSNRSVPERPEDTPEGILRQMGAYAHALGLLYPGRRVETAILWTRTARLMPLPAGLVAAALARAEAELPP